MMADEDFAVRAARKSFQAYESIGKRGKPQEGREWTLLATFLKTNLNGIDDQIEVVTLATGSKCIGESKRSPNGNIVNDSHAEILARRLLLLYFFDQMKKALTEHKSIFKQDQKSGKFKLLHGIEFHLFTSHTPCGDASIFPKCAKAEESHYITMIEKNGKNDKSDLGTIMSRDLSLHLMEDSVNSHINCVDIPTKKQRIIHKRDLRHGNVGHEEFKYTDHSAIVQNRVNADEDCSYRKSHNNSKETNSGDNSGSTSNCDGSTMVQVNNKTELHNPSFAHQISSKTAQRDINRTGAKCVPLGKQDLQLGGEDYHVTSVLRTKPGRGERTLSMSCSDKIMRWCTLGLQGGLMTNLIETPIPLSSVIIGKCPFNYQSAIRAFSSRDRQLELCSPKFCHRLPKLYYCPNEEFVHSKRQIEAGWVPEKGLGKTAASGSSILFCKQPYLHEVIVNGMKQGATKKKQNSSDCRCAIAKSALFAEYKNVMNILTAGGYPVPTRCKDAKTYGEHKLADPSYCNARQRFFETFSDWMMKATDHEQFT